MSERIRVLARPEVVAGFALAGVPGVEAGTPAERAAGLRALADDPSIGVVLIEDSALRDLPDDLQRSLAKRPLPIVVPFPRPAWQEGPAVDQYIVELLRQVIGYRVRLR
ncbi:MAG TPA: V-type ATP synthase subunit F [Gemmatimonadales bacterium]|nr:V-type ATP synthase subunit F [Gemmatimonadales bacterium]